jgi:hypothetical protein
MKGSKLCQDCAHYKRVLEVLEDELGVQGTRKAGRCLLHDKYQRRKGTCDNHIERKK